MRLYELPVEISCLGSGVRPSVSWHTTPSGLKQDEFKTKYNGFATHGQDEIQTTKLNCITTWDMRTCVIHLGIAPLGVAAKAAKNLVQ